MSVDMMIAAEDIITGDTTTEETQQQQTSQSTVLPSQPVERLFMERKGKHKNEIQLSVIVNDA